MGNMIHNNKLDITFLQLGDGPALRGFLDVFIDRINTTQDKSILGAAVVPVDSKERLLYVQADGQYTMYSTGYGKSLPSPEEREVTSIRRTFDSANWEEVLLMANEPALEWIFTDVSNMPAAPSKGDIPENPRSLAGWVASFLHQRYWLGYSSMKVVCCENIRSNAQLLHAAVRALSENWGYDTDFLRWLDNENQFITTYVMRNSMFAAQREDGKEKHVLITEGFNKWWVELETLPPLLEKIQKAGADIRASATWKEYEQYAYLWKLIYLSVSMLSRALNLESIPSAMQDQDIRSLMAHALMGGVLPLLNTEGNKGLEIIAESFERLENQFCALNQSPDTAEAAEIMKNVLLPAILYQQRLGKGHQQLTALMALMLMELIAYKEDERLHALSCDMEPEMLAYAILSDESLWGENVREIDGIHEELTRAFRDLQLLGIRETIKQSLPKA